MTDKTRDHLLSILLIVERCYASSNSWTDAMRAAFLANTKATLPPLP